MKTIRLDPDREQRLRGLLVLFAIGSESGKQFDVEEMRTLHEDLRQMLGEISALRDEVAVTAQLESDLRGLRDQGLEDAREISRLTSANEGLNEQLREMNTRLASASRDVEQLLQTVSIRVQAETADFNRVRRIRDTLDPTITILNGGATLQRVAGAR